MNYEEPAVVAAPQEYERQRFYQQGYQPGQSEHPAAARPVQNEVPSVGQPQQQQQTLHPPFQGQPQYFVAYPMQPMQPLYGMPVYNLLREEPDFLSRLGAAFCYAGGWITGLLMLLFAHDNRYIRFHAIQSVSFFGIGSVLFFCLIRLGEWFRHPFNNVFILGFVILCMILAVGWLVGVLGGLAGKSIKLPFVGHYAERYAAPTPHTTVK